MSITTHEPAPHTLARRGGPTTSQKAAQRVAEFARHHRAQILQVLTMHPAGLTVHEIASQCRLDAHAVGKRMSELETSGDVEVAHDLMGEQTRPSPSGRPARVWRRVASRGAARHRHERRCGMNLNPNHPVTQLISDQWHKLAALAVAKAGGHVVITLEDLRRFAPGDLNITVQELPDGLHLQIVDRTEAERLARQHGGLPM